MEKRALGSRSEVRVNESRCRHSSPTALFLVSPCAPSFALKIQPLRLEALCWMLDVGGEVQGEHMRALDLGDLYLVGSPTSPELL